MTVPILVATPHTAFGELLRISLEESGLYQVRLVQTAKEARVNAARGIYPLAILDADLADEPFVPLCYELIGMPMRVMIVPPDNDPNHPALGGLIPNGYVTRPFYLPELLEMVEKLAQPAGEASPQAAAAATQPAADRQLLTSVLAQEVTHCDAVEMLVGTQDSLVSCAGQLDEPSVTEMASVLLRYWDPKEKTDLMRYVRLGSTKSDYLAYATALVDDFVLMMVFEPGAQLSQARPQTRQVAASLIAQAGSWQVKASPVEAIPPTVLSHGNDAEEPIEQSSAMPHGSPDPEVKTMLHEREETSPETEEDEIEPANIDLAMMLGSIPPPDPVSVTHLPASDQQGSLNGWFLDSDEWNASGEVKGPGNNGQAAAPQTQANEQIPYEASTDKDSAAQEPAAQQKGADQPASEPVAAGMVKPPAPPTTKSYPDRDRENERTAEQWPVGSDTPMFPNNPIARTTVEAEKANTVPAPFFFEPELEIDPLSDTRPHRISTITSMNQLETASPALSLLNYTCVLLPRIPQHYLTGELADRLAQWVQHLCLAFGWRLEGISVRPEYLQWTVQVAPSVSPGNLVRIIRQRTSLHIFNTFEAIKQQNPSGDFWATGYLIVSGPQPPSAQLLREYIAQTRKRQGITK